MTTHAITSFDTHHIIYNNETYARTITTYSSTTKHPYLSTFTIPSIHLCDNLLYDAKVIDDVGSATSTSSYINGSEHYDNAYINTYDNPIEYLENYNVKQSLINLSQKNENLYDHGQGEKEDNDEEQCSPSISHSTSPVLLYLENKNLALCACIISILLLVIIGLGIFLMNKLIRPVVINTTVNNHYEAMNMSNATTTTMISRSSLILLLRKSSVDTPTTSIDNLYTSCPPDHWGVQCENVCKPCGLGVCHSITGECTCPADIYGEFCDLWKVDDKPRRGDMTS